MKKLTNKIIMAIQSVIPFVITFIMFAILILFVSFAEKSRQNIVCENISIRIEPVHLKFVTQDKSMSFVTHNQTHELIGKKISEIDLKQIEMNLLQNEYVEEVKAYVNVNGNLKIEIRQRIPILRIIDAKGNSYYIDRNATKMPLAEHFSKRIIIASGNIYEPQNRKDTLVTPVMHDLLTISKHIQKDKYLSALCGQIYVNEKNEFEIIPRISNHRIILGDASDLDKKFEKLKAFYKTQLPQKGWDHYHTINLKFENQIIANY